jgi:hypothetical protein
LPHDYFSLSPGSAVQVGRNAHMFSRALVPIEATRAARDQIRALAVAWVCSENAGVSLTGAQLLLMALADVESIGSGPAAQEARREYLTERLAALELIRSSWTAAHPLGRWKLWNQLNRRVSRREGRDPVSMNRIAGEILAQSEGDAGLEWHRLFLSRDEDEFPVNWSHDDPSAAMQDSHDRWLALGSTQAQRLVESHAGPGSLYAFITPNLNAWKAAGLEVWTGRFIDRVRQQRPEWLRMLLEHVLSDPSHRGDSLFGPLLYQFRSHRPDERPAVMNMVMEALSPDRPILSEAAVLDVEWQHRAEPLSPQERVWMSTCLARGGTTAAKKLLHMLAFVPPHVIESDGIALAAAALAGQQEDGVFQESLHTLDQWKYLYHERKGQPVPPPFPSVLPVLQELTRWPRFWSNETNAFFKFYSALHPGDVWEFFTTRLRLAGSDDYTAIPYDDEFSLDFSTGFPDYEARLEALLADYEAMNGEDWRIEEPWKSWISLAGRAGEERFLRWLRDGVDRLGPRALAAVCRAFNHGSEFVFTQPHLVKRLLQRATVSGRETLMEAEDALIHSVDRSGVWMKTREHRSHSMVMEHRAVMSSNNSSMDPVLQPFYAKLLQSILLKREFRGWGNEDDANDD